MTDAGLDLRAIERAAARGWPALQTMAIDGWLARSSSGGSVRANSVAALDYQGRDLDRSIASVVAFYRSRGAVPRFTISDVSVPAGLDAALDGRGWQRHGAHVTFAKDLAADESEADPNVLRHARPTPEWYSVYLAGVSDDRRAVAPRLVDRVPEPRAFFTYVRDGRAIGSGLSVPDGALASVQCMATLPEARRTGAARAILRAIEIYAQEMGARRLYLQTDLGNAAAIGLYERAGYAIAGHYHTRELPPG